MKQKKENIFSVDVVVGNLLEPELHNNNYFSPNVDIYETQQGIFIEVELPGVSGDDIRVLLNNNKLFIKVRKLCHKKHKNIKYYLLERPYGSFEKLLELPPDIDSEKVEAVFKEGVLYISVPYRRKKDVVID